LPSILPFNPNRNSHMLGIELRDKWYCKADVG
jgi:hypothetical protein